ncbi:coiled-coil domain-containing protein 134 isoform X1 [Catharus ustulatus]|uniref:coiled-coil domain-containing protein 134 isoform X1 n=1 Tax=Catharus ustulatus TaxID=91951 RepID=UPI00140E170F|nr:coiled-coil domain-containing protein 134 isoform X1 [Catharus ustulatus]
MPFIYQNTDLPGETKSYRDAVEEVLCSPAMADGATGRFLCSGLEGAVGAQIRYMSHRDEEASSKLRVTPSTTTPAPLSCCPQSQQVPAGAWPVAVAGRSGGSGSDTAGRSGEAAVAAAAAAAAAAAWQRGGREHRPRHPAPGPQAAEANMDFLIICPFLLALLLSQGSFTDLEKQRVDSGLEIYKKLFEVKRKDQMNALKNLIELNDVNQQYKIIDIMLKGLFKVLEDSRAVLIAADVPPDGPFPQDEKIKDAYSHVVENTAFFGDVVLRFPKIVHHYFDRNSNWNSLIRWGIGFCNLTGVFEQGPHSQVLRLMAQELGISEKSPDYRNPFKTDQSEFFPSADTFQKALRDEEKRRKKEEKRKEIRKGPRISRSQSEL